MNCSDTPGQLNIADLPFQIEKNLIHLRIWVFIGFYLGILGIIVVFLFLSNGFTDIPFLILFGFVYLTLIIAPWILEPSLKLWLFLHPGYALIYPDKVQYYEYDRMVKEILLDPSVEADLGLHHSNLYDTWVDGYSFKKGTDVIIISVENGYRGVDIERMWELFTDLIRKHHMKGNQETADYLIKIRKLREQKMAKESPS